LIAAWAERDQDEQVPLGIEVDIVTLFRLQRDVAVSEAVLAIGCRADACGLEDDHVLESGGLFAEAALLGGLQEVAVARACIEATLCSLDQLGVAVAEETVVAVSEGR